MHEGLGLDEAVLPQLVQVQVELQLVRPGKDDQNHISLSITAYYIVYDLKV